MKNTFANSMSWLHTWSGLLLGWVLFAIFFTGTLSYFRHEINQWMQPERKSSFASATQIIAGIKQLSILAPNAQYWQVTLADKRDKTFNLSWSNTLNRIDRQSIQIDSTNLKENKLRDSLGGGFFRTFHYTLHIPNRWGRWLVCAAAMFMLIGLISGIFTHRAIIKDFFTFRRNKKGRRTQMDFHNISAIMVLPFHFMITISGLVIFMLMVMPWAINSLFDGNVSEFRAQTRTTFAIPDKTGNFAKLTDLHPLIQQVERNWKTGASIKSLRIFHPNDANAVAEFTRADSGLLNNKPIHSYYSAVTGNYLGAVVPESNVSQLRRVIYGLHEAKFANSNMRWLFFLCGIAGCGLIGSGLILWVKRRQDKKSANQFDQFAFRLIEKTNVAAIMGIFIATGAYFYANRILAIDVIQRSDWEVRCFLFAWLFCLLHAWVRPPQIAWKEQLVCASVLFLGLPLLDGSINWRYFKQAWLTLDLVYLSFLTANALVGIALLKTLKKLNDNPYKQQLTREQKIHSVALHS